MVRNTRTRRRIARDNKTTIGEHDRFGHTAASTARGRLQPLESSDICASQASSSFRTGPGTERTRDRFHTTTLIHGNVSGGHGLHVHQHTMITASSLTWRWRWYSTQMVKSLKNDQERRDQETTVRVVHKNVTEEYSRVE